MSKNKYHQVVTPHLKFGSLHKETMPLSIAVACDI